VDIEVALKDDPASLKAELRSVTKLSLKESSPAMFVISLEAAFKADTSEEVDLMEISVSTSRFSLAAFWLVMEAVIDPPSISTVSRLDPPSSATRAFCSNVSWKACCSLELSCWETPFRVKATTTFATS
jgi:hypothetical protein